jgi:hypothetical protein
MSNREPLTDGRARQLRALEHARVKRWAVRSPRKPRTSARRLEVWEIRQFQERIQLLHNGGLAQERAYP